jgi:hypothetical protein
LLFAFAMVFITSLHQSIKTMALGLGDWLLALILAPEGTSWIDVKRLALFQGRADSG